MVVAMALSICCGETLIRGHYGLINARYVV